MSQAVVILGASDHPQRFSNQAQSRLLEKGYRPIPVNPRLQEIDGVRCYPDLQSIVETVDTVTVYVRPSILEALLDALVELRPQRVILNPGSESEVAVGVLEQAGIEVQIACTLILLDTNGF